MAPGPRAPWRRLLLALALVPAQVGLVFAGALWPRSDAWMVTTVGAIAALALAQIALGALAVRDGVRAHRAGARSGLLAAAAGALTSGLGACCGWFGVLFGLFAGGGGWGRPLRVRGRQLHPELRLGSDWTRGARPDASGLDPATRRALEALWLHDAQKEHASVPAFARLSWLLAACGAPAELLAWSHRAALEEIEHAELCFALAAGYGGRAHTVEPMPELLVASPDARGHALATLATESLADGCLLEDFNADIAAAGAAVCEEPVTRAVLEQIAREERSHAEFSWAVVAWALAHDPAATAPALAAAATRLERYRRPTAVSRRAAPLVARADAEQLRRHGRLCDARWAEAWSARLAATAARVESLLKTAEAVVAR
ncbi:MAG: hypothetical protein AB7O97_18240 [Planctomycetota bacterium]